MWTVVLLIAALYLLGMVATLFWLANVGTARTEAGLFTWTGFTGKETPALQLAETAAFWPWAVIQTKRAG